MREARIFAFLILLQVAFLLCTSNPAQRAQSSISSTMSTVAASSTTTKPTDLLVRGAAGVEVTDSESGIYLMRQKEKLGQVAGPSRDKEATSSVIDAASVPEKIGKVSAAYSETNMVDAATSIRKTATPHQVQTKQTKPSLIIAGLTRNSEKDLYGLRRSIQRVFQHFDVSKIIFFENDSVDGTVETIEGWNKARWMPGRRKVVLITEHNLRNVTLENRRLRTTILAHGRNRLWREILIQDKRNPVDYVLLMDMDEVNHDLSNVEECLNLPSNWTGCCSNTYTIYYDLWALRSVDPNWLPNDISKIQPKYHTSKYRHIPAGDAAIPVNSCFGGAALYDLRQIRHLNLTTYSGTDETDSSQPVCEHVGWYESIRKQLQQLHQPHNNMQLYIQPKMMNRGPSRLRNRKPIIDAFRPQWEATWNRTELAEYYKLVLRNWRGNGIFIKYCHSGN